MPRKNISFLVFLFLPTLLFAHGGHGDGILGGFTHPIFGIDHNVAILGTSILGFVLDYKRWYLYLLAFLIAMIIGGVLGIGNEATFMIEKIIAFSVLVIGLAIALIRKVNIITILVGLAFFGFFHGYAHGAEMPATNTALKYISGYSMGTIFLGLIGWGIGLLFLSKNSQAQNITLIGGMIMGCGVMMLLG